jgi:UDP-glucose 4-epimerase
MNIFVTGSSGFVGKVLSAQIINHGHNVISYDIAEGYDLLNKAQLEDRIQNSQTVIHCAYASHPESFGQDININLQMMTNIIDCCIKYQIPKMIFLSSMDVTGLFKGEGAPQYFPIDEYHPTQPSTSYGIHKLLSEQLCELTSKAFPIEIAILRPPGIWNAETYEFITIMRTENPKYEYDPFWEYGAFIDVRDLVECISLLVSQKSRKNFSVYNIASNDITTSGNTTLEWLRILHPDIPCHNEEQYLHNPYLSLVNTSNLKTDLDWEPQYTWAKYSKKIRDR